VWSQRDVISFKVPILQGERDTISGWVSSRINRRVHELVKSQVELDNVGGGAETVPVQFDRAHGTSFSRGALRSLLGVSGFLGMIIAPPIVQYGIGIF